MTVNDWIIVGSVVVTILAALIIALGFLVISVLNRVESLEDQSRAVHAKCVAGELAAKP